MDEQTAAELSPSLLCGWCGELITEEQRDTAHLHHDNNKCDFFILEENSWEALSHEFSCEHQIAFHDICCRKCGQVFAGV